MERNISCLLARCIGTNAPTVFGPMNNTTTLEDYRNGFDSTHCELLPAFIRYDCSKESLEPIDPPKTSQQVFAPAQFGDDWSEPLSTDDKAKITAYFQSFDHVKNQFRFVRITVGGKTHIIDMNARCEIEVLPLKRRAIRSCWRLNRRYSTTC
jgi:hypothetical protein